MLGGCPRVRGPQILGRHLFEQGVLDHFLVEEIGELERAHREQLDGLLQRWRQNQLLKELGMKFLLQHEAMVNEVVLKSGHVSVDVARHFREEPSRGHLHALFILLAVSAFLRNVGWRT